VYKCVTTNKLVVTYTYLVVIYERYFLKSLPLNRTSRESFITKPFDSLEYKLSRNYNYTDA